MSGFEVAEASGAGKGVVSAILSKEVFTFFSTWDLDTSLLDQLETQLNSVEALLRDAEEKLIDKNVYIEKWAQKARFTIYDADDFLDKTLADVPGSNEVRTNIINTIESSEYSTEDKIKSNVKDVVPTIHPSKKIIEEELGEIIERLQSLAAQKDTFGLKEKSELSLFTIGRPTSIDETFTIYGRSEDKHTIIRMLNSREGNDDAFRVIPIVGKSGIGKTTLACLVFHDYRGLNRSFGLPSWLGRLVQREDNRSSPYVFDVKGWICVSDKFDATHVIKSLLESITGQESKLNCSLKSLQHELKKQLQGKKYLIVLDDFWSNEPEDWNVLQTCFSVGVSGSRVIITTRSTEVARTVTTIHDFFYELDKLSRDESWFLFEKTVFRDENSSKQLTLTDIGLDIVSRCNGLPMSIKMIGRLLLLKGNDEIEWRSVLNNKIWENSNIIPSIWLSYYDLPSEVRKCFAYCSVFPKGYLFTMEEVTMLWIGEGLIEKFCEDNRYEDVARAYFTHLCSKLFFQESGNGGSEFVMHDLVRDLALYVSRGLCVNLRNVTVQSRRLSYVQGKEESLLNNMSGENVRHLRTFLPLRGNGFPKIGKGFYFNNELFGNLLSNFKLLRVLSLNGYAISKLPDSVVDMKLLRYLDLSYTNIDYLPSKVCQLYNLRILLMSGCRNLTRLPSEICNLVNLRYLHIDGTNLEEMPDGIGKMTNIRTLSNFVVDGGKSKQKREFKELPNIKGILQDCRDEVMEESGQKCFACGFGCRREVKKCACKMGTIIVPEIVPPPTDDCLRLKKALDGWGAEEEELIRVMGRRNATQRKQITEAYQDLYKESLLDRIDSELSGDFKKAVLLWVYDPAERDARLIRKALKATKQLVKQLEVLVEVACTTPPTHLSAVRKAYSLLFHCSIEQDIRSNVPSTPLQKLLVELVRSFLHDSGEVDTNLAISEAAELYKCIKARLFESGRFLSILSTRNIFQLRETFECYQRSFKNPIDQDIKSSGRADSEAVFSLMAHCIHKPEMHFAEVIRKATVGLGTDEDSITRAIVTRAEVDMVKIKSAYSEMYKSTVESAVAGDTSGYYKAFLMTLLGTNLSPKEKFNEV